MNLRDDVPAVIQLSDKQLYAYNAADIDAFCACYADDVVVLDEEGKVTMEGLSSFRERYAKLFEEWEPRADIVGRVHSKNHSVELEKWSRKKRGASETLNGEVIVRYTERDGKLAIVEFLK